MLPPAALTPPLLGTPARVNPFSLRQDLNGGRCKLLDTPSKSVISLTFTLPALRDPCASPHLFRETPGMRVPPRRCQSLPCTPELGRTVASQEKEQDGQGDEEAEDDALRKEEERAVGGGEWLKQQEEEEEAEGEGEGFPVQLEMVSLERLDEEEEDEEERTGLTEPMDCTKSPEAAEGAPDSAPGRPLLTCASSLRTNGWRLPISNGPPSLPPLPRLDNNNGSALVPPAQWGGGAGRANGYGGAQVLRPEPAGPSERDEVLSCPGCCLVGLSFPSVCLRGSAAVSAPRRRASLPRQRPYWNLNGTITGGGPSSSPTATPTTKALLCRSANGLVVAAAPSGPCEPGRPLPEAQR